MLAMTIFFSWNVPLTIVYQSSYLLPGFSILSGVEILFFLIKCFFSNVDIKEARRNNFTKAGLEPEDTLQHKELDINT